MKKRKLEFPGNGLLEGILDDLNISKDDEDNQDESFLDDDEIEDDEIDKKIKRIDDNEKQILNRYDYIYNELQKCTNVEEYQQLCKEYAVISMKAARLRNHDDNAKMRCVAENQYYRIDKNT